MTLVADELALGPVEASPCVVEEQPALRRRQIGAVAEDENASPDTSAEQDDILERDRTTPGHDADTISMCGDECWYSGNIAQVDEAWLKCNMRLTQWFGNVSGMAPFMWPVGIGYCCAA